MEQSDEYHYLVFGPQNNMLDNYVYSNYIGDYMVFHIPKYINHDNWTEYELLIKYFESINFYPKELLFSNCINCSELCNYNDKIFILNDITKLLIYYGSHVIILHKLKFNDDNIELVGVKQYGKFRKNIKVFNDDELSWYIIDSPDNKYNWDKINQFKKIWN